MQQPLEHVPLLERPSFETVYTVGLSFLRQALRWLGVAERDIDDVLQDVMIAAYHALDSFDPRRSTDGARAGHTPAGHEPSSDRRAPQPRSRSASPSGAGCSASPGDRSATTASGPIAAARSRSARERAGRSISPTQA
ncbi:sigma factor [Sorangium sp. So ce1078]|uniref:sigma factor n=1 Tax=Sorangium sp. So ce1078 TaxID=3133329 RepID=UPI003F621732